MDDSSQRDSKKLTGEEIKNIRKSIDQMMSVGFTNEEIREYIPEGWAEQLWEMPVDKRKLPRNPERQEQVKELLIKGKSMNKIAEELGVSIGTVQYWAKKIGPVETKSGKKKAKEEMSAEEYHKKWSEQIKKAGDFWLRAEELMLKDGLSGEQAEKQAREELNLKKKVQQNKEERKEE